MLASHASLRGIVTAPLPARRAAEQRLLDDAGAMRTWQSTSSIQPAYCHRHTESPERDDAMSDSAARKDDLIQIRASAATKAILERAAAMRGQKLSEFMLESARARAEETILDQRLFALDDEAYKQFLAMLDAPARFSKAIRGRMKRKLAWER